VLTGQDHQGSQYKIFQEHLIALHEQIHDDPQICMHASRTIFERDVRICESTSYEQTNKGQVNWGGVRKTALKCIPSHVAPWVTQERKERGPGICPRRLGESPRPPRTKGKKRLSKDP